MLKGQFSAFHRIASDEVWHFYSGDPLLVHEVTHGGRLVTHRLGGDPEKWETFFTVVHAGSWFELAGREALAGQYPQHAELIGWLTR